MISGDVEKYLKEIEDGSQIFLDYDGTLVPIIMDPELCFADSGLREILEKLDRKYELYIISGRTLEDLKKFINLNLNYVYLHGMFADLKGKTVSFVENPTLYFDTFRKLEKEVHFPEGSGVRTYRKLYGFVIHLGLVPDNLKPEYRRQAEMIGKENDLEVYYGINLIELKVPGVNKGRAIRALRNDRKCMIAGDEATDEYGFVECPECLTIHIGNGKTAARLSVKDIDEFREILEALIQRPDIS